MTTACTAILAETPHWFIPPYASPLGVPLEELATHVRGVVSGAVWNGSDLEALKLIAYGLYTDALTEAEASALMTGSDVELSTDIYSALGMIRRTKHPSSTTS